MVNKLDWAEEIITLAVEDNFRLNKNDVMLLPTVLEDLYEQGDTPEEAYRKYQEGEV